MTRTPWLPFCLVVLCCVLLAGRATAQPPPDQSPPGAKSSAAKPRAAQPKLRQTTGIVTVLSDASIVIMKERGKGAGLWKFVRTNETRTTGTLKRTAKVTVYYYEEGGRKIAKRIKVLQTNILSLPTSPLAKPGKSGSNPAR